MFNLVQELAALIRRFREDQIDYAICGGVAMALHGFTRATEDTDVLIEAESLPRIRVLALQCGFRLMGTQPDLQFTSGARLVRLVKAEPGSEDYLVLDLMPASGPNSDAWASRHDHETQWGSFRVVSREALKNMKRESGRPQDLADAHRLDNPDEAS